MKIIIFALLAFTYTVNADASEIDAWGVTICDSCTSTQQFEIAGADAAGTTFNGMRDVLVINSSTSIAMMVTVTNIPDGEVIWGEPGNPIERHSAHEIVSGELIRQSSSRGAFPPVIVDGDDNDWQIQLPEHATSTRTFALGHSVPTGFQAQITTIIGLTGDSGTIVLPSDTYFDSYWGTEHAAISLYLYAQMSSNYPFWSISYAGKQLMHAIYRTLKLNAGKDFRLCAIFENGDSACYLVYPGKPSEAEVIEGSQKNVDGAPIAGTGGGGGGGGSGLIVHRTGQLVTYSSGGWLYISCGYIGGRLVSCSTE